MAVNDSRSMNADFEQGSRDRTYIQLTPDRGVVENPPSERLGWQTYSTCEQFPAERHQDAHFHRAALPRESWKGGRDGDPRY